MGDDALYAWLMADAFTDGDGLPTRPRWMLDAVCTAADPAVFFPDRGEWPDAAANICKLCPVRGDCLEYAMTSEAAGDAVRVGVWGGLSPRQRADLARERAREAA